MIWPTGLNLDHDLVSPDPWSLLLASLFFLSLLMLALRFRKSYPIPTLGIFWMMAMLVPTLLVPNSDALNESRAYLSLAGFTLTASWVFCHFLAKRPVTLKLTAVALSLLLFMPLTMARNENWKDDFALWQDTVLKSPAKARAHYNLGVALAVQGKNRQSEVEFQRARDLNPEDHLSWAALAYCAEVQDNLKVARTFFQQALRLKPENEYARGGLERVQRRLSRQREKEL
jgi:tetratricopeptide (TPR) repeat protein